MSGPKGESQRCGRVMGGMISLVAMKKIESAAVKISLLLASALTRRVESRSVATARYSALVKCLSHARLFHFDLVD